MSDFLRELIKEIKDEDTSLAADGPEYRDWETDRKSVV